ncbi:hypothetical protein [Thalassomonas haliotis]|uniref:Uncharacterized protein n=1 Tax=Thalassomonas haliotis TaxID=485448 RepID=A0ABY7VJ08_9GAMM|nr:hypothetical protein [Thalassomonas haliotis]WDE12657.1 hypothetical protein H3N35_04055 [Thalassomonas haliotis]
MMVNISKKGIGLTFLVMLLLTVSFYLYKSVAVTTPKTSQWKDSPLSIFHLLINMRSINMPQLIIFNEENELILHITQLDSILSYDFSSVYNREIPKNKDFKLLDAFILPKLNLGAFNVFLVYPDPECLKSTDQRELEALYANIPQQLINALPGNNIEFNLLSVHQGDHKL